MNKLFKLGSVNVETMGTIIGSFSEIVGASCTTANSPNRGGLDPSCPRPHG